MAEPIDAYEMKMLLDANPNIVTLIDPRTYTTLYQNKSGKAKLGDIKGKTCYQNIPKLDTVCPFCKMPEALRTGQQQNSEVPLPGGTWLLVQFSPVKRNDARVDIVETITDISEIKKREEDLKKELSVLLTRAEELRKPKGGK